MVDIVTDKKIGGVKFTVLSPDEVRKMSAVKITIPDTYNDDGYPIENGLVDTRMGVIDPGLKCRTCGARMGVCPGHFGHMEIVRPVIHPLYGKVILYILQSTCDKCFKTVLGDEDIEKLKEELEEYQDDEEDGEKKQTSIFKFRTKKVKGKICPHCGKKQSEITLLKPTTFYKNKKVMLPTDIREWLENISNDELRVLGLDPINARPEWMILTVLAVPPVNMRPSITLESGERSEDDLTHKLVDIIRINQRLDMNINAGAPQLIIEDLWELLQYHCSTYFNNELANTPPARHRSGRALKTLTQRLKGKEGRFRYNLSGKRVNFSARTVISPDPRLKIDEVGVPEGVAREVTIPIKVTTWNIEGVKKYILADKYPQAIYVIMPNGHRVKVTDSAKQEIIDSLVPGSIVERQVIDGDITLFNRQPSLHRVSMMGHTVKILPGKTLRVNPAVCPPYNADFDGDEMNLHIIQNVEAQVEIKELMQPYKQVLSPRHGRLIIAPNEDHISGAFKLTYNAEFDKADASYLLSTTGITRLPEPDKGDKYSGKLLMSLLIPEEINFEQKTEFYSVDQKQGHLIVDKGVIIQGALDKRTYTNIGEKICYTMGFEASREFLNRSTLIGLNVLKLEGFSLGLQEYELNEATRTKIKTLLTNAEKEIDAIIMRYKHKTLKRGPGMTLRETVENEILGINAKTRKLCGKLIESSMDIDNVALIVAKIKARGSIVNTINMSGMVGQQSVRNKRLSRGYSSQRTLCHFKSKDLSAKARGFIPRSFHEGLTPVEHFFQSMGGRDSMVIKALRTGRSGYMQRRMVHALQDIYAEKDLSARELSGKIIQFVYGGDGLDPTFSRYEKHI
ncbi:DNA-directed RNA polymerase subunit A' [Candidatus Micrarchaeota archaeon]|nr:DNA-directed RNA polymerase subunit A' [Candidatus Micrarchaeota archaeon]